VAYIPKVVLQLVLLRQRSLELSINWLADPAFIIIIHGWS